MQQHREGYRDIYSCPRVSSTSEFNINTSISSTSTRTIRDTIYTYRCPRFSPVSEFNISTGIGSIPTSITRETIYTYRCPRFSPASKFFRLRARFPVKLSQTDRQTQGQAGRQIDKQGGRQADTDKCTDNGKSDNSSDGSWKAEGEERERRCRVRW